MIYGYAIMKRSSISCGKPYCAEWSDYFEISKVRLFTNKKERDNAIAIEKENHHYYVGEDILPFTTKSKQGKLNFNPKLTIVQCDLETRDI